MAFKCSSNTLAASRVGGGGGGWNPAGLGQQLRVLAFQGPWASRRPGRTDQAAKRARSKGLSRPRGRTKRGEQQRRRREARPLPRVGRARARPLSLRPSPRSAIRGAAYASRRAYGAPAAGELSVTPTPPQSADRREGAAGWEDAGKRRRKRTQSSLASAAVCFRK
ncbi:hypothetical protein AB1E18_007266 [Capra hircus]